MPQVANNQKCNKSGLSNIWFPYLKISLRWSAVSSWSSFPHEEFRSQVGLHYALTMIFLAKLIFYIFSLKPLDFGNAKLLESPSQQGEALYPLKPWSPWPFGTLETFRSWSPSSHGTRVDTLIRDVLHSPMKLLEDPLGPWKFKPLDLWEPRSPFTLQPLDLGALKFCIP